MKSFNEFLESYLIEVADPDETINESKPQLGYNDMMLAKKSLSSKDKEPSVKQKTFNSI